MPAKTMSSTNAGMQPALRPTYRPPVVRRADWVNPVVLVILGVVGVLFIRSAQGLNGGSQWEQQTIWLMLGAVIYIGVARVDYHFWMKNAHWVYLISLGLLILLWTPLGVEKNHARRWLELGVYQPQPSESAKIGTMIMVASILARMELGTVRESLAVVVKVGVVVTLPFLLIYLQPDLGSSLVFFPMVFAQLYLSNLSSRFFVTTFGVFLLIVAVLGVDIYRYDNYLRETSELQKSQQGPLTKRESYEKQSWLPLYDYQRDRIVAFFDPGAVDPQGTGASWQQNQSLIAVGSGGLGGKGYENGTQARLGYLPTREATNDFIMAVFLEEAGFIGGMGVLALYAILLGNTLRIAGLARDRFGQLICVGVAMIFIVHVFVNIGMVQGLMPVKGISLPLLSYGGSFVLTCSVLMGLVQSIYRHRREAV